VVVFGAGELELKSDEVGFTKLLTPGAAGLSFVSQVLKSDVVTFGARELELKNDEVSFTKLLIIKVANLSLSFVGRELKDLKAEGRISLFSGLG